MHGRNPWLAGFEQFYCRIAELIRCLDKITAIGPQACHVLCDNGSSCGAGEAGDIFPAFEVVTYVFRSMEIICWYQIGVYLFFFHKNAKGV